MLANYSKYVFTRVLQRLGLSDLCLAVGRGSRAIIPNPPRVMKVFSETKYETDFLADPSLQVVLERARGARTFWDVGANMGLFSILARHVNPDLQVVSIEASTDFYEVLCRNWRLNPQSWTCLLCRGGGASGRGADEQRLGWMRSRLDSHPSGKAGR
jgi:hypothetical protein